MELATLQWVHGFTHDRLLEPIVYIPPADAEEKYYRQIKTAGGTVLQGQLQQSSQLRPTGLH